VESYKLAPVEDFPSFVRAMALCQLTTTFMVDSGLRVRVSLAWKLLLGRCAAMSLMDRSLCAWVCATPAGRRYSRRLNAALSGVNVVFSGGGGGPVVAAATAADAAEDAIPGAAASCTQNVAFMHVLLALVVPIALLYFSERRQRSRFLAAQLRAGPPAAVRMVEPWRGGAEYGGHILTAAIFLPTLVWNLLARCLCVRFPAPLCAPSALRLSGAAVSALPVQRCARRVGAPHSHSAAHSAVATYS